MKLHNKLIQYQLEGGGGGGFLPTLLRGSFSVPEKKLPADVNTNQESRIVLVGYNVPK